MDFSTIICVDDEEIILQSMEMELSGILGNTYDFEFAQSGEEALDLIEELMEEKTAIPLIISDYIMPGMKGDELLEKVHQLSPDTLCVMLTGQSSLDGVINAINKAHLYRYLSKPWQRSDLALTVKEALAKYDQTSIIRSQHSELQNLNKELERKVEERSEQLREKSNKLQLRNEELETQRAEFKELNQVKDKLFSIISHDLKGPLNSLRSVLQLANSGGITADELKMLMGSIGENVNQTYFLLDNLLSWAKTQMMGEKINTVEVDFHKLTESTIKLLQKQADGKLIKLQNQIGEQKIAYADEDMMKLVLRNLISNAIKFTETNGEINVQSEQIKGFLQISVTDNGKGISEAEQEKLFDIRETLSTEGTAQEKGTGLGLALCKDCVEKNHGRIWVESELGKGSKFHFTVPTTKLANS